MILICEAEEIIGFVYTSSYIESKNLVRILACFVILERLFGSGINADALLAIGKQKVLLGISIVSGVMNIVVAFLLIPSYGASGAVIATGAGNCVASILMAHALHRYESVTIPFFFWLRVIVITGISCAVPYALVTMNTPFGPGCRLPLLVFLWAVTAKWIGLFSENDLLWLEKLNPAVLRVALFFRKRPTPRQIVT
jgi:O-antigen/teichoic acid export membrane protein